MKTPLSDADLEATLTEWGRAARSAAGHQPMPGLTPRTRTSRHFGWQLAVGVTAVAVAAALVVGLPKLLAKDPADPLHGITSTASAPPGFQVVTFHGLSITVPASWQVARGDPCRLDRSIVELPGFSSACGRPAYPGLTIVDFGDITKPYYVAAQPIPPENVRRSIRTTISGLPATRVDGTVDRPAFAYSVPALSAWVRVEPAAGQTGDDLAASLRVDAVDAHGCPVRVSIDAFPAATAANRPGAAEAVVPGQPVSIRACRYIDGWLNQGATVAGAELSAFVRTVNGLPAGLSRSADGPGLQQCPGSPPVPSADPAPGDDIYRFQLSYPDGPQLLLVARFGFCGDFGISNGRRSGQLTLPLITLLCSTVGCYGASAGGLVPVR